jgi:DNA polymerase elongation subunit (family B)
VRCECDPDVLTGFDIGHHDVKYLTVRMQRYGLDGLVLGRHASKAVNSKKVRRAVHFPHMVILVRLSCVLCRTTSSTARKKCCL